MATRRWRDAMAPGGALVNDHALAFGRGRATQTRQLLPAQCEAEPAARLDSLACAACWYSGCCAEGFSEVCGAAEA